MTRTTAALLTLALWIIGLATLGAFVQQRLSVSSDLRLFLPSPGTPEEGLLLTGIGEGPASRVLVVALGGAPAEQLADASRALAAALRASPHFRFVANGDPSLDSFPADLLAYRYLLSETFDERSLDAGFLAQELRARLRDLASPLGMLLEPWVARDPTLEIMKLVERWQPLREPLLEFDVWFDRAGERALLIAETLAPAFDSRGQRAAIDDIERTAAASGGPEVPELVVSGTGMFSAVMETLTRDEAESIGRAAAIGMIVLLLVAYRSFASVVFSMLPLASAGLAGLAAVTAVFGSVHGITLAFGITLIGVAQDYPIHLLSHARPAIPTREIARSLWPTLAAGIASTCVAYATFLFSGVLGLAQLAVFTVTGLAVAGVTTRFVLPLLISARVDRGKSELLLQLSSHFGRLPRPAWTVALVTAGCAAIILMAPQPFWQNDLAGLTPVPADLIARDEELRSELGTADLRFMLVVHASDEQAVLRRLEALDAPLQALVQNGAIRAYDHAARYVSAANTQRTRQSRLPDAAATRTLIESAQAQTPFRPGVFEPFVEDVATARALAPLTPQQLRESPIGAQIESLLPASTGEATALVTLSGVDDVTALRDLARASGEAVTMLDLKEATESLVARQRAQILWALAVSAVLLIGVVAIALRKVSRVVRVVTPMALTTLVILAVLQAAGVSLTLFHLISLILAAGLGLDYALFFERAADDSADQARTLHATLVCASSTLLVFVLLSFSSLPVLRAIGIPVAIGVVANFTLALLLTARSPDTSGRSAWRPEAGRSVN